MISLYYVSVISLKIDWMPSLLSSFWPCFDIKQTSANKYMSSVHMYQIMMSKSACKQWIKHKMGWIVFRIHFAFQIRNWMPSQSDQSDEWELKRHEQKQSRHTQKTPFPLFFEHFTRRFIVYIYMVTCSIVSYMWVGNLHLVLCLIFIVFFSLAHSLFSMAYDILHLFCCCCCFFCHVPSLTQFSYLSSMSIRQKKAKRTLNTLNFTTIRPSIRK